MSLREEQCQKVCRILDDVLANRPTERDSLIVAVRKAFAQPKRGKWISADAIFGGVPFYCFDSKIKVFWHFHVVFLISAPQFGQKFGS